MPKRSKSNRNKYLRAERKRVRDMQHPPEIAIPDPKLNRTDEEIQEYEINTMETMYGFSEINDSEAIRNLYKKKVEQDKKKHLQKFNKAHLDLDNEADPTGGNLVVDRYVEGNKSEYEEISGRWPEDRRQWRM